MCRWIEFWIKQPYTTLLILRGNMFLWINWFGVFTSLSKYVAVQFIGLEPLKSGDQFGLSQRFIYIFRLHQGYRKNNQIRISWSEAYV